MPQIAAGNMGNSILNLIYGQQNDPAQQMSDYANALQARNRVAIGTDLQGNLLPAPAPGTPPGVGSGQITGAPQDPTAAMAAVQQTGILPQGQEANATKTPQSMGSMIIALQRQQEAAAGLQQSIGLGMSAFARPENRERVFKSFAPQAPMDPTKLGDSIMNLSMQTQGQDRMNALGQMIMDPQRGPGIASQLNIGWDELKARFQADPGATGTMLQQYLMPTPDLQNLQGLGRMGAGSAGGGANPSLNDAATQIVGKIGGQPAMSLAQQNWRDTHKGQPDSAMPWRVNDPASFAQYTADEGVKSNDRLAASNELIDKNETATRLQGDLETLKTSPGLQSILTTPGKRAIAQAALEDKGAFDVPSIMAKYTLTPPEADAIATLKRVGGATTETAMRGMAGTGTRVTQMEVGPLKDSIATTQNLNQSYDSYIHQALAGAITRTKKAVAANYGNTGNVSNMPAEYAPWLNSAFKKSGQLYKEGSGVDELPAAKPIPADLLAGSKKEALSYPVGQDDLLDNLQQEGYDTSRLRQTTVARW